jgi:hypothetical protein
VARRTPCTGCVKTENPRTFADIRQSPPVRLYFGCTKAGHRQSRGGVGSP